MQETAPEQVGADIFGLFLREDHIPVPGHMQERILEKGRAVCRHGAGLRAQACPDFRITEPDQVWQGGRVGIPIAPAAVFQYGDLLGLPGQGQ